MRDGCAPEEQPESYGVKKSKCLVLIYAWLGRDSSQQNVNHNLWIFNVIFHRFGFKKKSTSKNS